MINTRINKLRKLMDERNIDAYIICTNDFHGSEYIGEYFKEREYMSGFSGSAGTMLVTKEEALLWTDGRYFIQAEKQLENTEIKLMKMGNKDVKGINEYLDDKFTSDALIGFDARTVTSDFVNKLGKFNLHCDEDLVDFIYENRPKLPEEKIWELDEKYAGQSRVFKLNKLREEIKKKADVIVITALDEIAWLLNLRGNDISCTPVFLSYMLVSEKDTILYVNSDKLDDKTVKRLIDENITIKEYFDIYKDIEELCDIKVWVDTKSANYRIISSLNKCNIVKKSSPVTLFKAIKNKTEIENEKAAHIKDGVAVTKFMHWLKENVGVQNITEISAAKKLEEFRSEQEGYIEPSFEPIMAYEGNGAIVHYQATEQSNAVIKNKGFLLSDTGAHYLEGTTDITRTFVVGELTKEQKKHFTLVLKGHLRLANAKFLKGYTGANLDYVAREPLYKQGLNYNHGTGHGVGYLLSVHEGPNSIRIKSDAEIVPGMITSNEPGLYIENNYGIRHENLIVCVEDESNEYGQFLKFEYLTMVPFDVQGIDMDYLNEEEKQWLREYHKLVYENISPYFDDKEKEWLKKICEF